MLRMLRGHHLSLRIPDGARKARRGTAWSWEAAGEGAAGLPRALAAAGGIGGKVADIGACICMQQGGRFGGCMRRNKPI